MFSLSILQRSLPLINYAQHLLPHGLLGHYVWGTNGQVRSIIEVICLHLFLWTLMIQEHLTSWISHRTWWLKETLHLWMLFCGKWWIKGHFRLDHTLSYARTRFSGLFSGYTLLTHDHSTRLSDRMDGWVKSRWLMDRMSTDCHY